MADENKEPPPANPEASSPASDSASSPPISYPMHLKPRGRATALSSKGSSSASNSVLSPDSKSDSTPQTSGKNKSVFRFRGPSQINGTEEQDPNAPLDPNAQAIQFAVKRMSQSLVKRKSISAIITKAQSGESTEAATEKTYCQACQKLFKKLVVPKIQCVLCKDFFCKSCVTVPNDGSKGKACEACQLIMSDPQEAFEKSFDKEDPELIIRCVVYMNEHNLTVRGDESKEGMAEFVITQAIHKGVKTLKNEMLAVNEFANPKYVSGTMRVLWKRIDRLMSFSKLQFDQMYQKIISNEEWMLVIRSTGLRVALKDQDAVLLKDCVLGLSLMKVPDNPYVSEQVFELTWEVVDAQLPPDQRSKRKSKEF
jgi:hypothetical protein